MFVDEHWQYRPLVKQCSLKPSFIEIMPLSYRYTSHILLFC